MYSLVFLCLVYSGDSVGNLRVFFGGEGWLLLLVDSLLLVVDCALTLLSVASSAVHIFVFFFNNFAGEN
jgi:hypothetical protein